jgi:hypothetical protein
MAEQLVNQRADCWGHQLVHPMVALTVPQWESMLVMLRVVLSVQTMERLME